MADEHTPDTSEPDTRDLEDTPGEVTQATVEADEVDARHRHGADREPTAEEEARADALPEVPEHSAESYREAAERGANVKGEGQIDR